MLWNKVASDPRWATLPETTKRSVADRFFKREVVGDPRYAGLNMATRNSIYGKFLTQAFPPPPKKPTIGERLTLTGKEDHLGGVLGPPLRGLVQTPLQFGTGLWRATSTILPSKVALQKYGGDIAGDWLPNRDDLVTTADMVDKAVQYMIPQTGGKYTQAPKGLEWINPWRAFNVLVEQGPTFVALGLKGLAHKKALTLFYSAVGTGQAVQAIRDYELETGDTVPEACKRVMPVIVGGISGWLDVRGMNAVFGKGVSSVIKGKFRRTLVQAIIEGSTEAAQEGVQMLGEMGYTTHDAKEVFDRLAVNAYGGLVLGGVASGGINYFGESSVENLNRTELEKPVEISSESVAKEIDAESEIAPRAPNAVDILVLPLESQNKIALNNEFIITKVVDSEAFKQDVETETGINGVLYGSDSEVDLNISQVPADEGGGFLLTAKVGDRVGERPMESQEEIVEYLIDMSDMRTKQFYKAQQSKMRAPDVASSKGGTKFRAVETTLRFYTNLDKVKGNVNLEQLPLKNLSKQEQTFIRSVAQDLRAVGKKVVTPQELRQAVEAAQVPITVEPETGKGFTGYFEGELKQGLYKGLPLDKLVYASFFDDSGGVRVQRVENDYIFQEYTESIEPVGEPITTHSIEEALHVYEKQFASRVGLSKPTLLGKDYTVPGFNPKTHERWLFNTPIDFGREAHPGISSRNAIGWAEVAEAKDDSSTLIVFEVQPSNAVKHVTSDVPPPTTGNELADLVWIHTAPYIWKRLQEAVPQLKSIQTPTDVATADVWKSKFLAAVKKIGFRKVYIEYQKVFIDAEGEQDIPIAISTGSKSIDAIAPQANTMMYRAIIQEAASKGYKKVRFPVGETVAKIEGTETPIKLYNRIAARMEKEYKGNTERVFVKGMSEEVANEFLQVNLTSEMSMKPITVFRSVEGREPQVTDPTADPDFQLVLERAKKTDMAVDIEVVDTQITKGSREGLAEGSYTPRQADSEVAGKIQIATPSGLYTAFHEIYHAYKDVIGRYNPLILQAEEEVYKTRLEEARKAGTKKPLNAEEAMANVIGEYATGRILTPSLETTMTDFLAKLRVAATDNVSSETIAKTVVNRLLSRDPLPLLDKLHIDPTLETEEGKKVRQTIEHSIELEDVRESRTKEKLLDALQRRLFDRQDTFIRAIKKVGGKLADDVIRLTRSRAGAESVGLMTLKKSMSDIYGGLTLDQSNLVDTIVFLRGEISKAETFGVKYELPRGTTLQGFKDALNTMKESDSRFDFYNDRATAYFEVTRALLDVRYLNGFYTEGRYNALIKNEEYYTSDHLSKDDPPDPFKELKKGGPSPRSLKSRANLESYIARVYMSNVMNDASLALYELTKANPKFGPGRLTRPLEGKWTKVVGKIEGEDKVTWLPEKLAKEYYGGDMTVDRNVLRWINTFGAGTKVVKLFATGINPLFHILYNPPMDWARIQLFTNTYSKNLPKGIIEMARDLAATASDVWNKTGLYETFVLNYGNQEFLTNMGQYKNLRSAKLASLQDKLGKLGMFTEAWSRVAQMRREMTNGKSAKEAAYISRNSLDYSQGGSWAKVGDTAIPYLNAGLQGARVVTSYTWNNSGTFAYKFGQLAVSTMALTAANMMYDEYDEVSEYDKLNSFIIMMPFTYTEKDGSTGRYYFKVRKEHALRPILYVTEQLLRWGMGKEVSPHAASMAAKSMLGILSVDPGNLPPTLRSAIALMGNYDLWRGQAIWRGAKGKMKDEWDENTPHIFRMLGAFTGLSPERLRTASGALVSPTNPFINLTGFGLEQLLRALSPEERERTTNEMLQDVSIVKGLVGTTYKRNRIMNKVIELREEEASKQINQNRETDRLSSVYWENPTVERRKNLRDYIRKQPFIDRSRLLERHRWQGKIKDVPDVDWWLSARSDSPETRAIRFYDRYNKGDNKSKRELNRVANRFPGFVTARFALTLRKLRRNPTPE